MHARWSSPSLDAAMRARLTSNGTPGFATGGTVAFTPQDFLARAQRSFTPRAYSNLMPSQKDWFSGIVSGMGAEPTDFWTSVERQFPTGVDPNRTWSGNF